MFAQHFAKKAQVILKCFCGGTKSARISLRGTKSASGYGPRGTKSVGDQFRGGTKSAVTPG